MFLVDLKWFTQRYADTIIKYFLDKGLNPAEHIIMVIGTDERSATLVKNEPFTKEEKDNIAAKALELNYEAKFLTIADIATSKRIISITDDRPFYWSQC